MDGDRRADSLTDFIENCESSAWSAHVVNRTAPEQIQRMMEDAFDGLSIDVTETEHAEASDDQLLLLRDGEVVRSSPLDAFTETLLFVNSDIYRTGTRTLEDVDPPEVITELSDTVFSLRGYPASNTEKLVLILMSRYIERRAWSRADGSLRTSFQRLSRLDDEQGTRRVYERLAETEGLDVHLYGVPDWRPPEPVRGTVHGVSDDEVRRHWFVVHRTEEAGSAALLARKSGPNRWRGFWTFDAARVRAIDRYVERAI